jgi:hypothetical protein
MIDINGKLIRLGDRIDIGFAEKGVVVFSLDTDEFSPDFPKDDWAYLGPGVMVQLDGGTLVFLDAPDEHTEIIAPLRSAEA